MYHLTSPSLCHGLPFWGYLLWLWRFFCPPSANLHSKGSVGAAEKERRGQNHVRRTVSYDPPTPSPLWRTESLVNCVAFLFFYHLTSASPSSLSLTLPPSSLPSYGALRQIPRPMMLAGPPTLAQAGSPWKSIAGYCWNNNHSNRSCKYLWDGNVGLLCQPKLVSKRRSCSWRIIPLCFTLTAIFSFIWNFMPFSTLQASVQRAEDVRLDIAVLRVNTGGSLIISD